MCLIQFNYKYIDREKLQLLMALTQTSSPLVVFSQALIRGEISESVPYQRSVGVHLIKLPFTIRVQLSATFYYNTLFRVDVVKLASINIAAVAFLYLCLLRRFLC